DWLRDCCNNHGTCLYQGDFVTPTRLIDVNPVQRDGREGVRLVESCSHNPEPYIAVSHCWGKAPIACCTTRNNIAEQYDIIDWQVLTKNFQDAITITRALNVRYIWIDSLCIIQGDKADWDAESSKMDTVYQQAYLTIAISSSADSTGGCFSSTYPDLCFQIDDGTHEKLTLGARCCDTLGLLQFSPEIRSRFPLFTRAWVFQERLLSRRILYCNYGEFAFQCLTTQTCECEKSNIAPHSTSRDIRNGRGQIWREIVADYLPNDLTRQADILPALSGCARIIGEWYGDEYIAGMWKSSLHVDLLWDNNKPYTEILKRKKEWTAPTWSWASL
ncbi:HET-domain-containing protein, partial [Polyplosphaeria fusca]